jgi:tRNA G46 methylase TrmB
MNNANFDYSFQYRNLGHQDTDKSRRRKMADWFSRLKQHNVFPPSKDAAVLEIGCGMGRLLAMLKDEGYSDLTARK